MAFRHSGGLIARDPATLPSDEQILRAAIECFVQKGYHGTTIRDVATRAGLSVPGLYHHVPSKMALLERLVDDTMDDLVEHTWIALEEAPPDPVERFSAVVVAHVRYHCDRPEESFVVNSELRSLSADSLRRVVSKRDRQQGFFEQVVVDGVEAGVFDSDHPHDVALAIVTMCTSVATWYHRDGPMQAEEIVRIYRDLALRTTGFRGQPPPLVTQAVSGLA
jgi:AcrR family transcriptional regulator